MNTSTAADESTAVPPSSWIPMKYPRRGGFPTLVDPVGPDADADLKRSIETDETHAQWTAWDLVDDPDPGELASAARSYLAGEVSATGAAAAFAVLTRVTFSDLPRGIIFLHGWIARHGIPFAVEAMMQASDMRYQSARFPIPEDASATTFVAVEIGHTELPANNLHTWNSEPPRYFYREVLTRADSPNDQITWTPRESMLDRMRALLAVATDDDYASARDIAASLRTNTTRRLTATYLFPSERNWSKELVEGFTEVPGHWNRHLMTSVNTAAEFQRVIHGQWDHYWVGDEAILAAVVDGLGADATTHLTAAFDKPSYYNTAENDADRLRILYALSAIPTDDAFLALIERAHLKNALPALLTAMKNYPRRAFKGLGHADSALFDRHARAHPELATELADTFPEAVRRRIDLLLTTVPDATDLPAILVTPPWATKTKPAQPSVVTGLTARSIRRMAWLPGELEGLQNSPHDYSYTTWDHYKQYILDTSAHVVDEWQAWIIFLIGPDEVARPLLTDWAGTSLKDPLRVVSRFELDALPLMLQFARAHPGAAAPYLMPYVDLDVARLHATALATRKNLRKSALAWMVRHADDATALLVPDAVGTAGPQRDHAAAALRALARATTRAAVVSGAAAYGPDAEEAVGTIVDLDPLSVLPKRIPKTPAWADIESLPPILTADRSARLPISAVANVLTMCAIGTTDAPYAGLAAVTEYCDRTSLSAAVWELFERWWGAGAPSKDNWTIMALGWLGDDTVVTRLSPLIRRWPGESGTARAQLGLDALAAHGSSRALTELDSISRKMKFKSLKAGAAQRVAEVAESLGLDREQLADRMVPDLDLSPDGTMTFDYGPRSFTVGFTESLVPFVLDDAGKKTAGLPKPTAQDDPVLAEESKKRFVAFKKEAKSVAAEQIKRLNRAMVTGRRWAPAEFTEYVLDHPLLIHVARRLLWASFDESNPDIVFRVAEDNTFADIDDDAVELPESPIGLVHPAHIPDTVGAWSDVFADYEILQPFPQLGRPVTDPLAADIDGSGLARFTGVTASPSQALRLTYRGWEPVWENPGFYGQGLLYRLSETVSVLLGLDPGMGTGSPYDGYPDQKLMSVTLRGGTLDDVDRAAVSELLADLGGFAT